MNEITVIINSNSNERFNSEQIMMNIEKFEELDGYWHNNQKALHKKFWSFEYITEFVINKYQIQQVFGILNFVFQWMIKSILIIPMGQTFRLEEQI